MTASDAATPLRSYLLLGVASLGYACYLFSWFSVAAFLTPLADALDLSNTAAGVLNGAVPLTYIPFALLSGVVIDRVGSRRAIGVGLLVVGVAHAVRGLATTFPTMLALTLVLGLGGTGITFGLPKLVSDLFPSERSGTMSSVYLIGLYAGTAAAYGMGRTVLGPAVGGWRPLFIWSGVVTAGVAVAWLLFAHLLTAPSESGAGTTRAADSEQTFALASVLADVRRVVTHRDLLLLVVIGVMYLFATHGLQGWLTVILQRRGLSASVSATITSGLIVAQLAGTLVLPPLSDYFGKRRAVIVACGALIALGTFGLALVDRLTLVTVVLTIGSVGVGIGGLATLVRSLPLELPGIGARLTGTAVGLVFMIGEIGGFAGPFTIGLLEDVTGSYGPGLVAVGLAGVVVIVTALPLTSVDSR